VMKNVCTTNVAELATHFVEEAEPLVVLVE
jgi:hypothetical protein